jgi:hypothetical protein
MDMPVDALIRLFRRLDEHFQVGRQGKVSSYARAVMAMMLLCWRETKKVQNIQIKWSNQEEHKEIKT